jgi:hypothetical protein
MFANYYQYKPSPVGVRELKSIAINFHFSRGIMFDNIGFNFVVSELASQASHESTLAETNF